MQYLLAPLALCVLVLGSNSFSEPPSGTRCSCLVDTTVADAFAHASRVYVGTVRLIEPLRDNRPVRLLSSDKQRADPNEVRVMLHVEHSWKGVHDSLVVLRTPFYDETCGYAFSEGETYLVYDFAWRGRYLTHLCSRTRPMSRAQDDIAILQSLMRQ